MLVGALDEAGPVGAEGGGREAGGGDRDRGRGPDGGLAPLLLVEGRAPL